MQSLRDWGLSSRGMSKHQRRSPNLLYRGLPSRQALAVARFAGPETGAAGGVARAPASRRAHSRVAGSADILVGKVHAAPAWAHDRPTKMSALHSPKPLANAPPPSFFSTRLLTPASRLAIWGETGGKSARPCKRQCSLTRAALSAGGAAKSKCLRRWQNSPQKAARGSKGEEIGHLLVPSAHFRCGGRLLQSALLSGIPFTNR